MKRFMSGLALFFLSTVLLGAGTFASDSEAAGSTLAGKNIGDILSDSGKRAVRFNPAVERVKGNLRKPAGYGEAISPSLQAVGDSDIFEEQYDPGVERAIGDLGKPADYDQTILDFRQVIPNFDDFIDQYDPAFDWRDSGNVTPADDQGSCGSCWAFASVGALESKILIGGGSQYDLSEQQVISCNTYGYSCCGGSMNALQFWYSQGPMQESCTGYGDYTTSCPPDTTNVACSSMDACSKLDYNTTGYYTVDMSNNDNIKASLLTDGPTYFRYDFYSDFYTHWNSAPAGAVYTQTSGTDLGGHAVLIIGWDDSKGAWLCKNSWGPSGGPDSDGTFWMAYSGHANNLNFGMANVQIAGGGGGGDVIQTWTPASNTEPWGIAYTSDNTVWVGDGWGANATYEYLPDGTATGNSWSYTWSPIYGPADNAFNWNTGMVWSMDVGGDNCLHEMDPGGGYTGNTICGPWTISQRGLAYDPVTDTWFVGGWNESIVYHIDSAGTLLDSTNVGLEIAGLAYNPDTQHLFVIENTTPNNIIYILDASNGYNLVGQFTIGGSFSDWGGAGLEIDCDGDLWAVDQVTNVVYEIDSGEETSVCGGGADCTLINDGSFENGPPPASAWTEWSSSGYEWIVDPTSAWGIAAYDGTYAFWGGGYYGGTPNSDYVEQSISVPAGATTLRFYTVFYRPDADDPSPNDYFYVKINGAAIFTRELIQTNDTYPNWVEQSVDISAYAGTTMTLRFEVMSVGDGVTDFTGNVLVDYSRICTSAGPGDELGVDFGIYGLWHYDGSDWIKLADWNPYGMEEWSGGLAADFSTDGLWSYNGSSWTGLAGWNPGGMEMYGTGLAVDFDSYGLWYYDGSWTNLAGWNATGMEEWSGGLAADFASYGLWTYDGSSWTGLAGWNPGYITKYGAGLAADFDSYGLWYYDGSSWTSLAGWNATSMQEWSGGLATDFASSGLWNYNGSSWTRLAAWNPVDMERYGMGLAVDFNTNGLWYYDGSSWTRLATWNPNAMEEWSGGLAVDFGSYGLWNYDGSSWSGLAGWYPEDLLDVNLY